MKTYYRTDGTRIEVTTGCIGSKTFFQSAVIGLIGGPLVWGIQGPHTLGFLAWSIFAMFLAPILVDGIRPVHTYYPPED